VYVREIDIPDSTEQKAIAHILGSLDDKIELNRQMNETLESMAQALFKSWFVDFDPVIDNALAAGNPIPDEFAERAERRTPSPPAPLPEGEGSTSPLPLGEDLGEGEALAGNTKQDVDSKNTSNKIQTQFPSEFGYTEEMGWIPKGWGVSDVSSEYNTVGGATPSTKNPDFWEDGDIYWTTPKDLSGNQSKVLFETGRKITKLGLKKISSGLLPIDTVLMSSRAPVG
jgi:type I restriction enzyme S subunit